MSLVSSGPGHEGHPCFPHAKERHPMTHYDEHVVGTGRRDTAPATPERAFTVRITNQHRQIDLSNHLSFESSEIADQPHTTDDVEHAHELLQADIELRDAVLTAGFDSILWNELVNELAAVGIGVVSAWIMSGEIYKHCSDLNRAVTPPARPFTADEREMLAADAVVAGLDLFREKGLVKGEWNPAAGACLSTYFIGACKLSLSNALRKRLSERSQHADTIPIAETDDFEDGYRTRLADRPQSVERTVLARLQAWAAFNKIPRVIVQKAVVYQAAGYSLVEIAELLSNEGNKIYTADAVRVMLKRQQKKSSEDQDGERHV
jgi:hypothetical protein